MADPPVWLLELVVNGRVERFATRPIVAVDFEGRSVPYRDGLADLALDLGADVAGGEISTAISISADWLEGIGPGGWSSLVAAFHLLEGSDAVLLRWLPGTVLESARVILRGVVEEAEHGGPSEPLEFTLRRILFAGTRPILNPEASVDASTWPRTGGGVVLDDKVIGAQYPRIYGFPGDDNASPFGIPGVPRVSSPAVMGQFRGVGNGSLDQLVIADGPVGATQVRIADYSDEPPTIDDRDVQEVEDQLGRTISIVDFRNPTPLNAVEGHAYYCGWGTITSRGGGTLRRDRSGVIRGAGELIQHLISTYTRVDLIEIDPRLDAWKIDTWINEGGLGAWEWIVRELQPICPFRLVEGRLGLAVRLMDFEAKPIDAVARFDVDLRQAERVSRLKSAPASGVANRVVVEYKRDRTQGTYLERYVIDANVNELDFDRGASSLRAATSQLRFARLDADDDGVRELVVQTANTWDPATAALIARYKIAELALPVLPLTLRGPVGLEQRIDPTDPIIVNDSEVGLLERVALVDRLTPRSTDTLIHCLVLDDPATVERKLL